MRGGRPIAVGIVLHDGHVLIGLRARDPWAGYAEFPGGKVLPDEALEAAARREVLEECGIRANVIRLLACVPSDGVVLHFFLCALEEADALPEPLPPFRWMPADRLRALRFPTPNARVLAELAALS